MRNSPTNRAERVKGVIFMNKLLGPVGYCPVCVKSLPLLTFFVKYTTA